ncbi:MAG TPA: DPP IV N-terminal domain-containing protein [Gemmatimonadales bacterium]|nr:DPP IV N-terminal domain-containing protein [Gemmatimonadales bacterium]
MSVPVVGMCLASSPLHGQAACEGRIAFVSTRNGQPGIFTINADGTNLARLTSDPGDGQPTWAPDGSRIAFLAARKPDERMLEGLAMHRMIYVMDADGRNVRRLGDLPAAVLRWSPDGTRIGFQSSAEDESNRNATGIVSNAIYVIDADGRRHRRLTESTSRNTFASWSPDGRRIAFASDRDSNWEIYVVDVETRREERLTTRPGPDRNPIWSPDGRYIAFTSGDSLAGPGSAPTQSNIHTLDMATGSIRRLTHASANEVPRAWSPDGRQILFVSDDLYLVEHESGRLTRLTHTPQARELGSAFLPGAPKVAFRSDAEGNWEIYVVGMDGTGLMNLTRDPADDVLMSVGPCRE